MIDLDQSSSPPGDPNAPPTVGLSYPESEERLVFSPGDQWLAKLP
jgi:hypothetical protein